MHGLDENRPQTAVPLEARSDDEAYRQLEDACIGLYLNCVECRPAMIILQVFREDDKEDVLACWITQAIDKMDRCPHSVEAEQAQRSLCLADGVFDLAGLVKLADDAQLDKVAASLNKVWSRHVEWRICAGTIARAIGMQGWVDPATTAGESLHEILPSPRSLRDIRTQVEEAIRLGEQYPTALRDHFIHHVLCRLCNRWMEREGTVRLDENVWPDTIGFVFGQVIKQWLRPSSIPTRIHMLLPARAIRKRMDAARDKDVCARQGSPKKGRQAVFDGVIRVAACVTACSGLRETEGGSTVGAVPSPLHPRPLPHVRQPLQTHRGDCGRHLCRVARPTKLVGGEDCGAAAGEGIDDQAGVDREQPLHDVEWLLGDVFLVPGYVRHERRFLVPTAR